MHKLLYLTDRIQRQIGREIGYVSQQVASNWALNNAKSISECLTSKHPKRDRLCKNVSELYINSFCIADQYCVNILNAYKRRKLPVEIEEAVGAVDVASDSSSANSLANSIVATTRNISKVLAHYHGWEITDQTPQPLVGHILDLHEAIYSICNINSIDLYKNVDEVIKTARHRTARTVDSERYDPVTSPILREFSPIKDKSVCTFAKPAKAWGARRYRAEESLEANLNDSLDILSRLSRCAKNEEVDALLLMLPGPFSATLDDLCSTVNRVLWFFGYNDPSGVNSLERIGDKEWRFEFLHMPYFVQTFGVCYDSSNTRFTQGVDATFIQFVTEEAFHRAIPREDKDVRRGEIREKAEGCATPYDVQYHDANAFVHNLRSGMPPVKWFKPLERNDQ